MVAGLIIHLEFSPEFSQFLADLFCTLQIIYLHLDPSLRGMRRRSKCYIGKKKSELNNCVNCMMSILKETMKSCPGTVNA